MYMNSLQNNKLEFDHIKLHIQKKILPVKKSGSPALQINTTHNILCKTTKNSQNKHALLQMITHVELKLAASALTCLSTIVCLTGRVRKLIAHFPMDTNRRPRAFLMISK